MKRLYMLATLIASVALCGAEKKNKMGAYRHKLVMIDAQESQKSWLKITSPLATRSGGLSPQTGLHVGLNLIMQTK